MLHMLQRTARRLHECDIFLAGGSHRACKGSTVGVSQWVGGWLLGEHLHNCNAFDLGRVEFLDLFHFTLKESLQQVSNSTVLIKCPF